MNYHFDRQEIETAIEVLEEQYPKCFFLEPEKRRPLKRNINVDLIKDGVKLAPELMRAGLDWYQSHFGYHYALQAGAKRIDLLGKEVATVSDQEQRNAEKYIRERKLQEREKRNANLIAKLPMMNVNIPKEQENPMPKAVKPTDPLTPIENLLAATRSVYEQQPEPLRRPFVVAGLHAVSKEIEKVVAGMENSNA